jgi:hypothetical protein
MIAATMRNAAFGVNNVFLGGARCHTADMIAMLLFCAWTICFDLH